MAETAPIHKNRTTTMGKCTGFISTDNIFKEINFPSKIYSECEVLENFPHYAIPYNNYPGSWKDVSFKEVVVALETGDNANVGQVFGPIWSTHWFRLDIDVPTDWAGSEVHLIWNSGSEATIWKEDTDGEGKVLQGVSPSFRPEFVISEDWVPATGQVVLFVEMACNNMFGHGLSVTDSDITPPPPDRTFTLEQVCIAKFNRKVFNLVNDFELLIGIAQQLPNDHRGYQALFAANEMINKIKREEDEDVGMDEAKVVADKFFSEKNGAKAHTMHAMAHCHIDTAWLWPYDETIRKCARSFSSQIRLMEEFDKFKFVCSQAQQFAWMEEYYPKLFAEIKHHVLVTKQFVPVGGCWIELDGNIPSGESFIRQFFYGQKYFQEKFDGFTCKEFWLPDTFGYSAQIPQICKHVGINRFLTQKMSWSIVNKFPHHNFFWQGIDGTEVMVHFPPGDSYNMKMQINELLFSMNNSNDKGRTNHGIYLYGFGDGGGGATRAMAQKNIRLEDVDGIPKVIGSDPEIFFKALEADAKKLSKWAGELYLELHNGTYTSQATIKWYNRKGEFLLRETEHLMCVAYYEGRITQSQLVAMREEVDENWRNFLLNQFHDVLPGTSIEIAMKDAWDIYEKMFANVMSIRDNLQSRILSTGRSNDILFNPLNWPVRTIVFINRDNDGTNPGGPNTQRVTLDSQNFDDQVEGRYRVPSQFTAALVEMPSSGHTVFTPIAPLNPVMHQAGEMKNGLVRVNFETPGIPYEECYYTGANGKEHKIFGDRLNTGIRGGMFYMYDDVPLFWDAWDTMDYHLETRSELKINSQEFDTIPSGPGPIVGAYKWTVNFGEEGSSLVRYTIIRADTPMIEYYTIVDWKENRKMLKVEFPVDILAGEATYEIQYGNVKRPTHMNTSWDEAKFEVCGHKWMDISQADRGVTILTDSKYGWCVRDNIIKLSLLKSPKNPDATSDMHKHYIYYAILPHEGTFQQANVIRKAYELNYFGANNVPLLYSNFSGSQLPSNYINVDQPAIVVGAFKPAHKETKTFCLRLYESFGGSAETKISFGFNITQVQVCSGLEVPEGEPLERDGNSFVTTFKPFEIKSFLLKF